MTSSAMQEIGLTRRVIAAGYGMISLGRAHLRAQEHDRVSQLAPPGGTALRPFDELSYEELARAHHGLVSKERRKLIEEDLKSGRLRAVCGNELSGAGNRHGLGRPRHQVEAPSSVPSGLQPIAEGWDEAAAPPFWPRTPSERGRGSSRSTGDRRVGNVYSARSAFCPDSARGKRWGQCPICAG